MADGVALLLYNNVEGLTEDVNPGELPGAVEALTKFSELVRDVLVELCGLKDFKHVEFLEINTSYKSGDSTSPLAVVLGTPLKGDEGELIGVSDVKESLDLHGAMTARQPLPELFAGLVAEDDGMMVFTDDAASKTATKYSKKLKLDGRFQENITEEEEEAVSEAMGQQVPEDTELSPLHPEDLLHLLPVFLSLAAGAPVKTRSSGPNILQRGKDLIGQAGRAPGQMLKTLNKRTVMVRQNVWRLEDFAVAAGKAAVKIARKAVRPVLIGYVLNKALTTIDNSRSLPVRMAKLPREEAVELYYKELLGEDFGKQLAADLAAAVQDVDEGLLTDEYKEEKRLLTAAMLRRLEVEEWDKERMKHFYLGSYGLGPWYMDMEDRLHNPYFMGARAWNGPIEGWVGKNKAYMRDMDLGAKPEDIAFAAIEKSLGKTLTPSQKSRILASQAPSASDLLTAPGGMLHGVLDKSDVQLQPAV